MTRLLLAFLIFSSMSVPGLCGVRVMTGDSVILSSDESVDEDPMAAGSNVNIMPNIDGDVTAAGSSVVVSGQVADSVFAAGNTVNFTGRAGNDIRLAGTSVTVSGQGADNAYLAGSRVTLTGDGNVAEDVLAAGGEVDLMGVVGGDARVAARELTIGGTVNGDVYAKTNLLRVTDGATINGDLYYESENEALIAPGAAIAGERHRTLPAREQRRSMFWPGFVWWLVWLLAAILFSVVVYLLFPRRVTAAADTIVRSLWLSIGVGFLALIAVPVAAFFLTVTIIGIPLALALMLVYFLLLYAAKAWVGLVIGRWILNRTRRGGISPLWMIALGIVVLEVVSIIPLVGWLFALLALLAGLGGFVLSAWRRRTPPETATGP